MFSITYVRFKLLKTMVQIVCSFPLQKQVEFLVEYADTEEAASKPVNFNVTPETLQNIREVSTLVSNTLGPTSL